MMNHYQLGKMPISIAGQSPTSQYVIDEFSPIASTATEDQPALSLEFCDRAERPTPAILHSPLEIGENHFAGVIGGLDICVRKEESTMFVQVASAAKRRRDRLPAGLQKLLDWNYLTVDQERAKSFVYGLFDFVSQAAQLPLNQSYIHASSVCRGEHGVLIAGWGGIGKTTAMLKLVIEDNWKYLSDDLVAVDDSGTVHRSPKKMQIYAYNLLNQPLLRDRLMAGRSLGDRLSWSWHLARRGVKGVRRRVSGEELYGKDSCAARSPITHAFLIERSTGDSFHRESLTHDEFAARATATLVRELDPYATVFAATRSAGQQGIIPTIREMMDASERILAKAVAKIEPVLIEIPKQSSPDDLADFMRKELSACY